MRVLVAAVLAGSAGTPAHGHAAEPPLFAGAEQRGEIDGVQADLRVESPPLAEPGSASGASVILTDARHERFAQIGWVRASGNAPRSFAAWSFPGGVAVRMLPGAVVGSLVVFKAEVSRGVLRLWIDAVDGEPKLAGIRTDLSVSEAQIEAGALGAARLAGSAKAPGVLGWAFTHAKGRWSRFAPMNVSADPGLGARRVGTLLGETGTHILVWDRGRVRTPGPALPPARGEAIAASRLRAVFGVELRAPGSSRRISRARARRAAITATGAGPVLSTRSAQCIDRQLVPPLQTGCYVVSLAPGAFSRPLLGARGGPPRAPLRSLTVLIDSATGRLIETLAT